MDPIIKGIVAFGLTNLVTGSFITGLSIGWIVYFYEMDRQTKV